MNILKTLKNLTIESLKDNKKLIIILYALLIIVMAITWALSGDLMGEYADSILNASSTVQPLAIDDNINALDLFITNEWGGIITYLASIFFGIFAIVSLAFNAINLGLVGAMFSSLKANGGLQFIIYLIPHGIFELTATVLESAAGILLFLFIWKFIKGFIRSDADGFKQKCKTSFEIHKNVLLQSVVLMIFSTILLLIAAPIEAHFSVPFSEFLLGA